MIKSIKRLTKNKKPLEGNRGTQRARKKGFTLIELVVVFAIIAIISLIAMPNFMKLKEKSILKADKQTMLQIEKITNIAMIDDILPSTGNHTISLYYDKHTKEIENIYGKEEYIELLKGITPPQNKKYNMWRVHLEEGKARVIYGDDGTRGARISPTEAKQELNN